MLSCPGAYWSLLEGWILPDFTGFPAAFAGQTRASSLPCRVWCSPARDVWDLWPQRPEQRCSHRALRPRRRQSRGRPSQRARDDPGGTSHAQLVHGGDAGGAQGVRSATVGQHWALNSLRPQPSQGLGQEGRGDGGGGLGHEPIAAQAGLRHDGKGQLRGGLYTRHASSPSTAVEFHDHVDAVAVPRARAAMDTAYALSTATHIRTRAASAASRWPSNPQSVGS